MTEPEDPEVAVSVTRDELAEAEADVVDDLQRPGPLEADDADVLDQKRDVPDDEADDYR